MLQFLKQFGKSVCYVGLYFGMQMLVSIAAVFGYSVILGVKLGLQGVDTTTLDPNVLGEQVALGVNEQLSLLIVISGVLALLFLWVFFVIRKKKLTQEANIKPFAAGYWPAVLLGAVGLCLVVNFGMQLIPIPEDVLLEYAEASESLMEGPFIMLFLANVIMAPLVEEILFRGLVFSRLRKAMPIWGALILSSVIFGLMHGQILWICYTSLVGVVLGIAAWKTDSILAPMFMHFAFNLFGTSIGYFVEEISGMTCLVLTIVGAVSVAAAIGMFFRIATKKLCCTE